MHMLPQYQLWNPEKKYILNLAKQKRQWERSYIFLQMMYLSSS